MTPWGEDPFIILEWSILIGAVYGAALGVEKLYRWFFRRPYHGGG